MSLFRRQKKDEDLHYGTFEVFALFSMFVSYFLSFGITISIIIEKFNPDEELMNTFFYLLFFLLPKILGGLKNIELHWKEVKNDLEEPHYGIYSILFPFSPLIRYYRAAKFGLNEKENWENGIRFIDESVTAAMLRLFDVVLGDATIVILLLRDDVWNNSEDWQVFINGMNDVTCYPFCPDDHYIPPLGWKITRIFLLLSTVAQCFVFYLLMVKRYQHMETPEYFDHLRSRSDRYGKVNVGGVFTLFVAHLFFIGSRLMGYSVMAASTGAYTFALLGFRWIFNIAWHLVTSIQGDTSFATKYLSSFSIGFVWLLGLTNEMGGRQLGRYILYYSVAALESVLCGMVWLTQMRGSGNYFVGKASWSILVALLFGGVTLAAYYSLCHPGSPSTSRKGLMFCAGDRRDPLPEEYYDDDDDDEPMEDMPTAPDIIQYKNSHTGGTHSDV